MTNKNFHIVLAVILFVTTMILGSLQFSSNLISICIFSPPLCYGYSIRKSRIDFHRFSIGGRFQTIDGRLYK